MMGSLFCLAKGCQSTPFWHGVSLHRDVWGNHWWGNFASKQMQIQLRSTSLCSIAFHSFWMLSCDENKVTFHRQERIPWTVLVHLEISCPDTGIQASKAIFAHSWDAPPFKKFITLWKQIVFVVVCAKINSRPLQLRSTGVLNEKQLVEYLHSCMMVAFNTWNKK